MSEREPYNQNKITNDLDQLRSKIEFINQSSVGYLSQHLDNTLEFIASMREPWLNVWDERDALKAELKEAMPPAFESVSSPTDDAETVLFHVKGMLKHDHPEMALNECNAFFWRKSTPALKESTHAD